MKRVLSLVVIVLAGLAYWHSHGSSEPRVASHREVETPVQAPVAPKSDEAPAPERRVVRDSPRDAAEAAAEDTARAYIRMKKPDLKTYRDQARQNPHQTPPALMRLADEMAARMEKAKASPDYAVAFFADLKTCASDMSDSAVQTVRAVCAVNAGRLAEMYPARLEVSFRELRRGLPENVSTLVSASGY